MRVRASRSTSNQFAPTPILTQASMPTRAQRWKTAFKLALTATSVEQVDKASAAPELNVNGKRDRQAGEQEEADDANAAGPSQTISPPPRFRLTLSSARARQDCADSPCFPRVLRRQALRWPSRHTETRRRWTSRSWIFVWKPSAQRFGRRTRSAEPRR